ncbi:MAG: murein hydrolase activator EnvC [Candidatus Pelagadaptatus aseana]|uniref:murein hydrolase activator EnvC family protein n=1 Tax=Candidatus Pelagadaptatus aseana TaxID=3120508 RepID=UPI0039B195A3
MRRHLITLLTILMLPLAAQAQGDLSEAEYQAKLNELQATIKELKTELEKVKSSRDNLENNLQGTEVNIGELHKKIERLKGELASQKKQLTQLKHQRSELQQQQQQQQQRIAEHINAAHRLGQQSQLKLLLNQQHPDQVARTLKYYEYFLEARSEKIDAYLAVISELDTLEPKIQAKTRQLEQSKRSLEGQHQQLRNQQQERLGTLTKLKQSIASKDQQLKKLDRDKRQLQQLLEEVTAAIANLNLSSDGEPFAKRKGKMKLPARGKIANRYGSHRLSGKLKWEGLEIKASEGSSVSAIHHGRVVFSDYLRGHGLLIIIDHGDDYMSLYANNQTLLKDIGDWVSSGEEIAKVGNSGGKGSSGLYFEIRLQGKPVNPNLWCKR